METAFSQIPPQQPQPVRPKPWYAKPSGIIILVVLACILIAAALFGWLVWDSYTNIQNQESDVTAFQSEFTKAQDSSATRVGDIVQVSADDDPALGNPNAPITIVAFEDFECPYSGQSYPIIRELMLKYPDDIYFVYRDFPVTTTHPNAANAALASECAQDQNLFWEFHDKLYQNQSDLSESALFSYAQQVGLDATTFRGCLTTKKHAKEIQADVDNAVTAGVRGTPTWFVNGQKIEGVLPLVVWESIVRKLQ